MNGFKSGSDHPLVPISGAELFIGLVGPVGSDLNLVCTELEENLARVGYKTQVIRLSAIFKNIMAFDQADPEFEDERIKRRMKEGTELRKKTEDGAVVAFMGIADIREIRKEAPNGEFEKPLKKTAYIFRSLKHPDEVFALRTIYGKLFFLVSAYTSRHKRVDILAERIAKSHNDPNVDQWRKQAEMLVVTDELEEGTDLGQDVTDAFPLADLFVNAGSRTEVADDIKRFIELFFGHPFHTPRPRELAMYFAKSAALRSADLSRQVGAAIVDSNNELITTGCNEVPKFGGGVYWPGKQDYRDFQYKGGLDSSSEYKQKIVGQVVQKFHDNRLLNSVLQNKKPNEVTEYLLSEDGDKIFKGTQIFDLLEFGRPIHAEMNAITSAAARGLSIAGSTLYSTTFPCHMCARHIISSGIKSCCLYRAISEKSCGSIVRRHGSDRCR